MRARDAEEVGTQSQSQVACSEHVISVTAFRPGIESAMYAAKIGWTVIDLVGPGQRIIRGQLIPPIRFNEIRRLPILVGERKYSEVRDISGHRYAELMQVTATFDPLSFFFGFR